jgi:signal transduction histidine kinase
MLEDSHRQADITSESGTALGVSLPSEQQVGLQSRANLGREAAARRLSAQRTISAALARPLNAEEFTRAILRAALQGSGSEVASLALIAADGDSLQVTEDSGPTHGVAQRSLALAAPDPLAAAVREGREFFVESPREPQAARADDATPPQPPGGAAAVPLVVAGRTLGAVGLRFGVPHTFCEDERAFILALAQQLAESFERQRLYDAERTARAGAETARRGKDEFLAMVSHEIRTPLNAIVGYTELLEMQLAGPTTDSQQDYLARIRASSSHLLGIINDMLDLAKVEAGRLLVTRAEASARQVIQSALAIVHPQATERAVVLLSHCETEPDVHYRGDPRRVEQIILNLLSNAVRFTDPPGRVTVSCRLADMPEFRPPPDRAVPRWCSIDVSDTGIGIAPEHLPSIFDPFVQVESGLTRTRGGSGLGLAISRRLARLMDGDVTVKSHPGAGSTFTLWLPAAAAESDVATRRTTRRAAPDRAQQPPGLTDVGDAVLRDVKGIAERYMVRLRSDPNTPSAHAMGETDLENHTATFVTDIAQALSIIEEKTGTGSPLIRHDHEIQQLIADRHGELRRQLGWSQRELERDFEILWEEVQGAVRRTLPSDEPAVSDGISQLKRFFDRAFDVSRRAYRREAATPRGTTERSPPIA